MVVDASVAIKWFVAEPGRDAAIGLIGSGEMLVAPDLIVAEVMNVLRRKHRQQAISGQPLSDAAGAIAACFSHLVPAAMIVEETVRLALRLDHSVYDCLYLACAVILATGLATADKTFASKASQAGYSRQIVDFASV